MKTIKITPNLARIQFDSMEEWLVNRKGIGGSDASAILGLNPYKTNQELWMEKKGQMSPVDISGKSYGCRYRIWYPCRDSVRSGSGQKCRKDSGSSGQISSKD